MCVESCNSIDTNQKREIIINISTQYVSGRYIRLCARAVEKRLNGFDDWESVFTATLRLPHANCSIFAHCQLFVDIFVVSVVVVIVISINDSCVLWL